MEFLGRRDHQVKVRGFRIELGEVESALRAHPGVHDAVVLSRPDPQRGQVLIAYVVPLAGADGPETAGLRLHLQARLAEYMIPAAFVRLEALPLTGNGKLDLRALPDPSWQADAETFVAPGTPLEDQVARIWAEVLGIARVGMDDDFFALGGHSLLGIQLLARVRAEMGVDVALRALFERPTPSAMASLVEAALPRVDTAGTSDADLDLLLRQLLEEGG